MQNDDSHLADDLFADTLGDDDSRTSDESTPSESEDLLNDSQPAKDAKSEAAQAQINAWTKKIESGTATLEELEAKQKWLIPHVKAKLDGVKAGDEDKMRRMAEEAAERLFEKRQKAELEKLNAEKFDNLYSTIQSLSLSPVQKAQLKAEYQDLIADGMPKYKALQKAAKYADIDFEDTAAIRRSLGSVKQGSGARNDDYEPDYSDPNFDPNSIPLEQLFKNTQKLVEKNNMRIGS